MRWRAERPGLPEDEWVDDIPFPETQNYVKRILGTAEDYRRLYGGGVLAPLPTSGSAVTPMAHPGRRTGQGQARRQGAAGQEEASDVARSRYRSGSITR